ncbi:MAG: tetratricopeptide repeat protein [Magnetococcales bacterium]|nr:tetratricopeptide repeat protein [Magnetococcales bacterium]
MINSRQPALIRMIRRVICLFILSVSCAGQADPSATQAWLVDLAGRVEFMTSEGVTWKQAAIGQTLREGEIIRTGPLSRVSLLMADESLIKLKESSDFVIGEVAPSGIWSLGDDPNASPPSIRSEFQLKRGGAWFLNKNREVAITFKTPAAEVGVRGTELVLEMEDGKTLRVTALEGSAQLRNAHGEAVVSSGEGIETRADSAPAKLLKLNAENAVQWFISVPPILAAVDRQRHPLTADQRTTLELAWQKIQGNALVHAHQLLTDHTARHPEEPLGWQLRTLTALSLDHREEMQQTAREAIRLAEHTAAPWILLAYVQQAQFALDEAERSLQTALKQEPNHPTALLALARLQFGGGRNQEALRTIEQAAGSDPHAGEIQSLRGFILLAERQTVAASAAFKQAIQQNTTLAEPHLGLGLALMRAGATAQAFEEISQAVLLDPTRSLFRSYWAKMLYQAGRHQKALDILQMAQRLDPKDPTPLLYTAIILRELNQPSQAIRTLQQAMALNDNQAVYRSRFLLDGDLAVKNVDLSRLYKQLDLDSWAQNKAVASTRQDYTNASGHLFYAGSLANQEERIWARNSEYLLARLLQPANLNTVNSLNHYTTFVEKPGIQPEASIRLGNHGRFDRDASAVGALPQQNLAYQIGVSATETKGWRSDLGDHNRSLLGWMKWDPTDTDSFMLAAAQTSYTQTGSQDRRFEWDAPVAPQDGLEGRTQRWEAGYHRHFAPGADLLLHGMTIHAPTNLQLRSRLDAVTADQLLPGSTIDLASRIDSVSDFSQLQGEFLFKQQDNQLLIGAIHYTGSANYQNNTDLEVLVPPLGTNPLPAVLTEQDRSMNTLFLQDIFHLTPSWTLEGALFYDALQTGNLSYQTTWDINQWSPRFGAIWTPSPAHTFRLAAFRSLLPLYGDRLEPADIAGVLVHRNGQPGTQTDELQLAWEYDTGEGLWSVALFDGDREYGETDNTGNRMLWENRFKGAELLHNHLLGDGLGMTARYRFLNLADRSATDRNDHLAQLGIKWQGADGWSAKARESYRFIDFAAARSSEAIWITDLELGYAFEQKKGSLLLKLENLFDAHFDWLVDPFVLQGRDPGRAISLTLNVAF